jgi:uncharacterized protein (DUF2062 family)
MIGPGMKGRFRQLARRLWREHTEPGRLSLAVAMGVFVGCSPFFSLHTWIVIGLALVLRLNKVAAVIGSQISIPPITPLLAFVTVQAGAYLLQGEALILGRADFTLDRMPQLVKDFFLFWLVGWPLVGGGLALVIGLLTYLVARRRKRARAGDAEDPARQRWRELTRELGQRFATAPPGHRNYVRLKVRMDPVYRQLLELLVEARSVVDLGTGLGLAPLLLALDDPGEQRRLVGVDWDPDKLRSARAAAAGLPSVSLVQADARQYEIPGADAVLLVDVLHYFPLAQQELLLRKASAALNPGGKLVIRETDRRGRSLLTRALEALAVKVGWNRGPGLSYRTRPELQQILEQLGLSCQQQGASSAVHRGNFLIWAQR